MSEPGFGDEVNFSRYAERITNGQLHKSPFEEFINHAATGKEFYHLSHNMAYDGTIGSAITDLKSALTMPTEGNYYKELAVLPQILIRGIIDYDIEHPEQKHIQNVEEAIDIGLASFRGDHPTALALLEAYEQRIGPNALTGKIQQKDDIASWMGTDPQYSYKKAIDLAFHFEENPLFFVALGQGATSAAMDVLLRHADITKSTDSDLYTVRYSRLKKKDERPVMTKQEAVHLQELAKGKQVILFEEDSVTAKTLQTGTDFFRRHVFPNQSVYPTSNYKGSSSANVY